MDLPSAQRRLTRLVHDQAGWCAMAPVVGVDVLVDPPVVPRLQTKEGGSQWVPGLRPTRGRRPPLRLHNIPSENALVCSR
jgi:hypothetical protein